MSTPQDASLSVLRGNPTPEEMAALLVVLTTVRHTHRLPAPSPAAERGWGRPAGWQRPAGWRHTTASTHERST